MAIAIEGYTVVALKARIEHLLESEAIEIPNSTALGDDDIWRCSFMAEADACRFMEVLATHNLNVSQGPDSDAVLVNEFDHSVQPYCEWLEIAQWDKAVIGWLAGTKPDSIVAREGWDPSVGSGLSWHADQSMDNLDFIRLDGNVEVYLNRETGEEVYIGRTAPSAEALYKSAAKVINEHSIVAGQPPVAEEHRAEIEAAIEQMNQVLAERPNVWGPHWFIGRAQLALGDNEAAYAAFHRAFEINPEEEVVPREFAGVCLLLNRFDEAVDVAEKAVILHPDEADLISNLALAQLLAGRLDQARKSIEAACKINPDDRISHFLERVIEEVLSGERPQPLSMSDLTKSG